MPRMTWKTECFVRVSTWTKWFTLFPYTRHSVGNFYFPPPLRPGSAS